MADPIASTSTASNSNDNDDTKKSNAKTNNRSNGRREDTPDVRISKTLSYILRHGAAKESLTLRPDGFVRVDDLVSVFMPIHCHISA